jgi:ATP-dependent DNA ligase
MGRSGKISAADLAARFGEVQLATLVEKTPRGAWSYEFKWDGYRIVVCKSGADVRLVSRNARDWTDAFPTVRDAVRVLTGVCVIEGEV